MEDRNINLLLTIVWMTFISQAVSVSIHFCFPNISDFLKEINELNPLNG